jgi:transcriptional regulator GlxA family with amidase domain
MKRRDLMKCTLLAAAPAALPARLFAADSREDAGGVPDAHLTAPLPVPKSGDIQVAFLISAGAEVVDFSGPWGVFQYVRVREDGPPNPFRLYTVAASKDPVQVSGGMTLVPDRTFADAPAPNVVVIPAMQLQRLAPAAFDWLRAVQKSTDVTMSVCDGSYVLARSGLVNGKTITAHHNGFGMLRAMYPAVNVVRGVRYVEDGKFASSGGLTPRVLDAG